LTTAPFGYILIAKDLQLENTQVAATSLIEKLRSAGLKATAPRKAVARVLEERREHLSADDIHSALVAQGVQVDLSSVYRTVGLLARLGLVRPVGPTERHGHFEIGHDERVHLVCARCGAVVETNPPRIAAMRKTVQGLAHANGFALDQFTIEATGECAACRRAAAKKPTVSAAGWGRGRAAARKGRP
jgi:Fur family ferric uptake transcriptional regulator